MANQPPTNPSPVGDHFPVLSAEDVKRVLEAVPEKPRCPMCGCFWNEENCLYCEHPTGIVTYRCPYCHGCLNGISVHGRENHISFCRLKHIPVKVSFALVKKKGSLAVVSDGAGFTQQIEGYTWAQRVPKK